MYKNSFEPIYNSESRILILGTLPGEKSLQAQRYYAHPQNAFWKILSYVYGEDFVTVDYETQKALLLKHRLGLWDTVHRAKRQGSLDSELVDILPNDIPLLIQKLPALQKIVFNGQMAYQLFRKYFSFDSYLTYEILPSTSPAHARMSFSDKLLKWRYGLQIEDF